MFLVISLIIMVFAILCKTINRLLGLPPGPTPLPFAGNLLSVQLNKIDEWMLEMKLKYGEVFAVWLPFPIVVIAGKDSLNRNIIKKGEFYSYRPPSFLLNLFAGGNLGIIFVENSWSKSQRRFILHSMKDIGMTGDAMTEAIAAQSELLVENLAETNGQPFDIKPIVTTAAANVITKLVFGRMPEKDDKESLWFSAISNEVFQEIMSVRLGILEIFPFLRHFDKLLGLQLEKAKKANAMMEDFIRKTIDEQKKSIDYDGEPSNFIQAYLQEIRRREIDGNNEEFTERQLVHVLSDMYAAGFDTITNTLRFGVLYAISYPHVQTKLQEELDTVIGKRPITPADQPNLHYFNAFMQEVYRLGYVLYLNFQRETVDDVDCDGYKLKKGTRVLPQHQAVHIDPTEFPNPRLLLPGRHLKDGIFQKDDRINPFSLGRRSCIGENLARHEVFVLLSTMFQNFSFLPEDIVPPTIEWTPPPSRIPLDFIIRVVPRSEQNLI